MGICRSCSLGWPKPVADIYNKALKALEGAESPLHFGPSHIVWADENFDFAQWCLDHFEDYKGDYNASDLLIVRKSLEELAKLPEDIYNVELETESEKVKTTQGVGVNVDELVSLPTDFGKLPFTDKEILSWPSFPVDSTETLPPDIIEQVKREKEG